MTPVLAAAGHGKALWYLTRGTGIVTLLLLTVVVALGVVQSVRWSSPVWPRFVTERLHRNLSLLVVVFLALHVVTTVVDGFAPIRWLDAVVPFGSPYRPVWLGLGAVALDLLAALVVTSLLRARLGHRTWRSIHWLAYASWPVALVHALGTGSDTKQGWMLLLDAVSVAVVAAAVAWRLASGWPRRAAARLTGVAAAATVLVAIGAWVAAGPLRPSWSRTAGTPTSLLARSVPATGSRTAAGSGTSSPTAPSATSAFDESFQGTLHQSNGGDGTTTIDIRGSLTGSTPRSFEVVLAGQALADGGVSLEQGTVRLGPTGDPARFQGRVAGLQGGQIDALLTDAAGDHLTVVASVQVDDASGAVTGVVRARPGDQLGGIGRHDEEGG